MMLPALLAGAVASAVGIVLIEKKRKQGALTYPLWKVNPLVPWSILAVLCLLFMGAANLPRFVKLALHGLPAEAVVSRLSEHCQVTYRYTVGQASYTDSDSMCGLKAGDAHAVYYVADEPGISTLYLPAVALRNEIIAIVLICLGLPTLLVLWLRMTWVIGRREAA